LQPRVFKVPIIELEINYKTDNPEITYIEELDFKMSGLMIMLDDRFLGYALTFSNELMEQLKTNITGLHPIFKSEKKSAAFLGDASGGLNLG